MKIQLFFLLLFVFSLPLFAEPEQARIAPGAVNQLEELLNKPVSITPAKVTHLLSIGKTWYKVEIDSHVFTDQVDFSQVVNVLTDFKNRKNDFFGKRIRMRADNIIRASGNETLVDFTTHVFTKSRTFRVETEYRVSEIVLLNTDTKFIAVTRQIPDDSETNDRMKNIYFVRYVQEVDINGKKYVYIRSYNNNDVNVSINVSFILKIVKENANATNEETLSMLIEAAKKR